jgi:hypothetical protein
VTVQTSILTYTDDEGTPLVQLVHKSVRLRHQGPVKGSAGYAEAPDWAVEFAAPYDWQRDGGGLPRELGPGRPDEIRAKTVADATEALARIGDALQVWIAERAKNDAALVQRVAAAALYGVDPELPLGDDALAEMGPA